MNRITFVPVGKVINEFDESADPNIIKSRPGIIAINKEYTEALLNIKENTYLDVVFYFDRLVGEASPLSGKTYSGAERGVFASRAPRRPNPVGITTVKLLEVNGNRLTVSGLDALNGSPVLDIKCCDTSLLESVHRSILETEPRIEIQNHIALNRTNLLLAGAAQLHGHFCPGLAMGVMAATFAMRHLQAQYAAAGDMQATVGKNNCLTDGIQWVTGCSLGNGALKCNDIGQTTFTLTSLKSSKSIRISSRETSGETIANTLGQTTAREKAFGTLNIPFHSLFTVHE